MKTEEEVDRILKFLDQLNEPDLQTLTSFGLEGVHYTKIDDTTLERSTDSVSSQKLKVLTRWYLTFRKEKGASGPDTASLKTNRGSNENRETIVANPAEPFISEVYSQKDNSLAI